MTRTQRAYICALYGNTGFPSSVFLLVEELSDLLLDGFVQVLGRKDAPHLVGLLGFLALTECPLPLCAGLGCHAVDCVTHNG